MTEFNNADGYRVILKEKPWRSKKYTDWVKSQTSVISGLPADDPHHVIGHGMGGMGTKASDECTFPLTRGEHDELHRDWRAWEARYGSQLLFALKTIHRAIQEGVLKL